ncbi:MAG: amino acid permease [Cytophagaceae bacterium]|nr:amino acid permease [Cytophagaceae bacterium]MDW8457158.1 amino acid permease [Cytophagaceae bacterium]
MSYRDFFVKKNISQIVSENSHNKLAKVLTEKDLTSLGIAAIIGAGIFSTIGEACAVGGAATSLLFVFTAFACLLSALCYAEFASCVPVAGSAYTYAYVSFGELVAWIIGWDLMMEYAIGNIAVAISWSDYFTSLLQNLGMPLPEYLCIDYLSAERIYHKIQMLGRGVMNYNFTQADYEAWRAWMNAPQISGFRIILDVPALAINIFITWLVLIGIKESKSTGNVLVMVKVAAILLVIAVGISYINPQNWNPFAPNGISGVLKGVSGVFFAYIGFDAISTTTEESINPSRDVPKAMVNALIICTLLYVAISLVITGMAHYSELSVGDPLAYIFEKYDLKWLAVIISLSAVAAMTSVLLVFQLGQPRILMSMSRDGLLPKIFSYVHPKYKTPWYSTWVTGIIVALPIFFLNHETVTDLSVTGTLFAFAIVCAGILFKRSVLDTSKDTFKVPVYSSKYIFPSTVLVLLILYSTLYKEDFFGFFLTINAKTILTKLPIILFLLYLAVMSVVCYRKDLSLIPVLGLTINVFLLSQLKVENWMRFLIWLVIGLIIYFCYGYHNSVMRRNK